ncbi:MAG: hypothetical protein M1820_003170 [Bogoriella megaspora]|nr:MAG: hypothetical protein M1820_003170 [Bogoriella megaspora]
MNSSRGLAFKALSSKIHPQLPLSPRESQQLLSILTTSFRQNLEREHPSGSSSTSESILHEKLRGRAPASVKSTVAPSSHDSAHNVLQAMLSSPHFVKPRQRSLSPGRREIPGSDRAHAYPVEWFQDQVARGTASMDSVETCLQNLSPALFLHKQSDYHSHAAEVMENWIWASGLTEGLQFVAAIGTTRNLVYLLVKYGHEDTLWRWMNHAVAARHNTIDIQPTTVATRLESLLTFLANARSQILKSVEAPFLTLFEALRKWPSEQARLQPESKSKRPMTNGLGTFLKKQLISRRIVLDDPVMFENFLASASQWSSSKLHALTRAQLMLVHPKDPDATEAFYLIQAYQTRNRLKHATASWIKLHLDTARLLLGQERFKDASLTLNLARERFPEELGLETKVVRTTTEASSPSNSDAEAANLRILDGLSLNLG